MVPQRVSDLMTHVVFSLTPRDDLSAAWSLMDDQNVRHLPIVDEDLDLVGLVTRRDLLRAATPSDDELPLEMREERLHAVPVGEVMTRDIATVEADDDVREAARLMLDHKFGCLPVVQGSRLAGILTEADFVRYFAAD